MKLVKSLTLGFFILATTLPGAAAAQADSEEINPGQEVQLNPRSGKAATPPESAPTSEKSEKKKAEARIGNIAGTSSAGGVGYVGDQSSGGDATAIGGSVHKVGANAWMMSVTNNSEDRFSVSLEIAQYDDSGKVVKRLTRSYTLAGGQTKEEKFTVASTIKNCELNLTKAKNLEG